MTNEEEFDSWITWPGWAKDAVVIDTDVHLSLRDAIRVLWKRRITVTTKTFTESVVGRAETLSRVTIEPWRRRRAFGVVESGQEEEAGR